MDGRSKPEEQVNRRKRDCIGCIRKTDQTLRKEQTVSNETKTAGSEQTARESAVHTQWLDVTVQSMIGSDPLRLTFYSVLTLRNGATKHCSKEIAVTDPHLLQRLREEVLPGDKIRVCIET